MVLAVGPRHVGGSARETRLAALPLLPEVASIRVTGRRGYHSPLQAAVAALSLLLVIGIFTGAWAYLRWSSTLDQRFGTPEASMHPGEVAKYRNAAWVAAQPDAVTADPVVLTYHDINPDLRSSPYVVTPAAFAAQMQMLHEAGYVTLTAGQFTDYVAGRLTPPRRSVLLTFDDGTSGLWSYGDAVLARYGFHAVSFVITGRAGTHRPYYLTWHEIARMYRTGRWDFESHTHDLHTQVMVGPGGRMGGNLSHRRYVNGVLESEAAFRARIQADLIRSVADLEQHGLPRPTLFAYPFSDIVERDADPTSTTFPEAVVARLFSAGFVDAPRGTMPVSRREAAGRLIERAELFRDTTARGLFDQLQAMLTLPVQPLDPVRTDAHWSEDAGVAAPIRLDGDAVRVDARTATYVQADWAPQRTADWVGYTVSGLISGLDRDGRQSGALTVRARSTAEVVVQVSANTARVLVGRNALWSRRLRPQAAHSISVTVLETATVVRVDGDAEVRIPSSGDPASHGGIGIIASRNGAAASFPTFVGIRVAPSGRPG